VFAQCFSACWNEYIPADQEIFQQVVEALLTRRKMYVHYASPKKDYPTKRWIEPHHLQHYNGSWYLLAWCLLEDGWRKFQLCRIEKLHVGTESFNFRPEKEWAVNISGACGIFQGQKHQTVRLRFTPDRARYVREQIWCENQQMESCEDGSLVLAFPVADFREIIMKILQHGAWVEVLEPPELRDLVQEEIAKMVKVYGKN
jgi:predicted DNA-binding transcriptional regulator YafY